MHEQNHDEQQDNLKVAPIMSSDKVQEFKYRVIGTVLGLSIIGHYDYGEGGGLGDKGEEERDREKVRVRIVGVFMYLLVPAGIVGVGCGVGDEGLHALAVLVPVGISTVASIIVDVLLSRTKHLHKYLMTALYSYLWSGHFFITRQLLLHNIIDSSSFTAIIILSIITVLTSSSTITFSPTRQFSASTFDYQHPNLHSTLYTRFYAQLPLLLTQLAIYYSPAGTISHPALPALQYISALTFVLWVVGWLSSVYNNAMFVVHNLMNFLVFGEQVSHSGYKFRGGNMWWVAYLMLGLNVGAIGVNVGLVLGMERKGEPQLKIVESQHVMLVCLATITSMITTLVFYCSYRCSQHKKSLIRFNKFSYPTNPSSTTPTLFFGHKQTLSILTNLLLPPTITLLSIFVLAPYYNAYNNGSKYQLQTNFKAQKAITWIILAVDGGFYVLFGIFREVTRVRSRFGCGVNLGCFGKFYAEVQRDLYIRLILKCTGALAIMALVLRIQNLQTLTYYILQKTPTSPIPHPHLLTLTQYLLLPTLIYRSYKRSQTYSHFFHITIIVACILTLIDSKLYLYQSIFVVLAFPNFPDNPLRLLLLSPWTVPEKLVRKGEGLWRVGYVLGNLGALVVYVGTLGTMEFTMIFGLPLYWCVIPTINCQSTTTTPPQPPPSLKQITPKHTLTEFEQTSQTLSNPSPSPSPTHPRSTPQHNLYQKIVSQLPFYMFRNKKPGYYLLRISKYIMLVEVVMDFYGVFQTVVLVGLETQEVTTCHAKEGETVDRMIQQTWSDNPHNILFLTCKDTLTTVLHEHHKIPSTKITTQNEIQLTGLIESPEFYTLFKKCLIKSLIFHYNQLLTRNPKHELTHQQAREAELLLEDLEGRVGKDRVEEVFPYGFLEQGEFGFGVKFREGSGKVVGKKKLPPINRKQTMLKKQKIIDQFADLIGGSSNTSNLIQPSHLQQHKPPKLDIDKDQPQSPIPPIPIPQQKRQPSQLHMAIIMSAYLSILGKINYLNPQRLYKMMKKDEGVLSQFQFTGGLGLVAVAVGCALKIGIGKMLDGEEDAGYGDFVEYSKNQFLGTLESAEFSQAISAHKQDIWTISYNYTKKTLTVKRLAKTPTPIYMFSFQNQAVQAVWNNLRFELLYATNDNDERYSIQTHPHLLRNLLVEGCEEPYGYAGYYSQQFLNL